MAKRFDRTHDLPAEFCTRQDFYDVAEQMDPNTNLVDESDETSDGTLTIRNSRISTSRIMPRWLRFNVQHTAFDVVISNSHSIELFVPDNYGVILGVYVVVLQNFFAAPGDFLTVKVGDSDDDERHHNGIILGTGAKSFYGNMNPAADLVPVNAYFSCPTETLNNFTSGSVDIRILYTEAL